MQTIRGKPTTCTLTTRHANMNWQGHTGRAIRNAETNPQHPQGGHLTRPGGSLPAPPEKPKRGAPKIIFQPPGGKKRRGGIGGSGSPTKPKPIHRSVKPKPNSTQGQGEEETPHPYRGRAGRAGVPTSHLKQNVRNKNFTERQADYTHDY